MQLAALWAHLPLAFPPVSQAHQSRQQLRLYSMSLKALEPPQLRVKNILGERAIPSAFPRGMSISTMQMM